MPGCIENGRARDLLAGPAERAMACVRSAKALTTAHVAEARGARSA